MGLSGFGNIYYHSAVAGVKLLEGHIVSAKGASFLEGSGGMCHREIFYNYRVSEIAFPAFRG